MSEISKFECSTACGSSSSISPSMFSVGKGLSFVKALFRRCLGLKSVPVMDSLPVSASVVRDAGAENKACEESALEEVAPDSSENPSAAEADGIEADGQSLRMGEAAVEQSRASQPIPAAEASSVLQDTIEILTQPAERPPIRLWKSIEDLAKEIWIEHGCPDGRALDHWLEAERRAAENDIREH
jgi:hypothetical protein